MNIILNVNLFRPLKDCNFEQIYNSDYATLAYVALMANIHKNDLLKTTQKLLFQSISNKSPTWKDLQGIKQGLEILQDNKLISFHKDGLTYTVNTENIYIDGSSGNLYFYVPKDYIISVMEQPNKASVLHHYLYLLSTINRKTHIGFSSQETIAQALNLSIPTVSHRHKLFYSIGVIYFSKERSGVDMNGNFVNINKQYCLPEDSNLLSDEKEQERLNKIINKKNREIKRNKKTQQKQVFGSVADENADTSPF
jgi:hypothetical protein